MTNKEMRVWAVILAGIICSIILIVLLSFLGVPAPPVSPIVTPEVTPQIVYIQQVACPTPRPAGELEMLYEAVSILGNASPDYREVTIEGVEFRLACESGQHDLGEGKWRGQNCIIEFDDEILFLYMPIIEK